MSNFAPAGTRLTLTIPRGGALRQDDFGNSGGDGGAFQSVIVATPPGAGTLYCDSNASLGAGRTAVVAGRTIGAADSIAGKLTYRGP